MLTSNEHCSFIMSIITSNISRADDPAASVSEVHDGVVSVEEFSISPDLAELIRETRVIQGSSFLTSNRSRDHVMFIGKQQ